MDKKMIKSPRPGQGHAHTADMVKLLSEAHQREVRKGGHWPDEGLLPVTVQGFMVWVVPIERIPGKKSSRHRVLCECPGCGVVLSVGRLHQHKCKVK